MELAQLYLKTNQLEQAFQHAQAEHQRRPENIDACETLAEILFKMGKSTEALPLIQTALRTHSQKPERLVLAGKIMAANGKSTEGEALIAQGMTLKPYLAQ